MSYRNPQMPTQQPPGPVIGQQQHGAQQNRPMVNNMPNGPTMPPYSMGLKQQYLPPQIHTNGMDNVVKSVSPAMSQPLNAAHLPPSSSSAVSYQQNPFSVPNATSTANPLPPSMVPSTSLNQQIPSQSRAPLIPPVSSQSTNYYQPTSMAKPGPPTNSTTPTAAPIPATLGIDKMASNLQNIHLNNGNGNGIQPTSHPIQNVTQSTANRLTNGNSSQIIPQQSLTGTMSGLSNIPAKSVTPNVAPPPLQNSFVQPNQNQMPLVQPPQQQPQFNGIPGPGSMSNKYPPMNLQNRPMQAPQSQPTFQQPQQQPLQPPQPQQQQEQFKNTITPNMTSNSTIGKRPLYPAQAPPSQPLPQQQQQPTMQQHLPAMPGSNATNATYNQFQQPPMPQNYPQTMQPTPYGNQTYTKQPQSYGNNVVQRGFDSMWGHNTIDLMQHRHILPTVPVEPPKISLEHQFYESVNCSPDIFRCTLTKIPESNALLQK